MTKPIVIKHVDGIKCFHPEVAEAYDNYPNQGFDVTEETSSDSFWVTSRIRLFMMLVQKYLPSKNRPGLLEVGCGDGKFLQSLSNKVDAKLTGSEIYLKGLLYARAKSPEIEFAQLDVEQGPMDEEFDVVCSFDVLEHISDDLSALQNIHSMLKPGGTFILSVPQYQFMWSTIDEIVKHKRRYSRKELAAKLRQQNFEVSYQTSFIFTLFPLMLLNRLMEQIKTKFGFNNSELEQKVVFNPLLNCIFDAFTRIDEYLIKMGLSLPFGGTLVMIAKKA